MNQTPVHETHNPDLLDIIPWGASKVIEVGCSSGALAREFKKISPNCHYLGIEIDPDYAKLAQRHCDESRVLDIEAADDAFWKENSDRDCWIFGDTLEHLRDPWRVLRQVRSVIPPGACIAACIPNLQHWSLQAKLSIGDFRYEDTGILDRTHLRFFSRQTILEMFNDAGFTVTACIPRLFPDPRSEPFLPLIEQFARLTGANPQVAVDDAMPVQYVISATPR
ncbi:Methyltransferase domain-containing protein [Polaromonas sp. YR568]|uniref:class I SAM-dependent methyltransferase n=1 Tax=Polaromonas sp. YR568 TaxID=1855301 RepID=UPI0008F07043|nr:class I SAM-dependent methyltransferase [Polaromonas sp. YR568]SFU30401.1 Methyltransferase domain-containing protein [Polaromonas sp. YR568]